MPAQYTAKKLATPTTVPVTYGSTATYNCEPGNYVRFERAKTDIVFDCDNAVYTSAEFAIIPDDLPTCVPGNNESFP